MAHQYRFLLLWKSDDQSNGKWLHPGGNLEGGKTYIIKIFSQSCQFPGEFWAKNITVRAGTFVKNKREKNNKFDRWYIMSTRNCERKFDFFTRLILDFSLYLGFTLLAIMITIGLYFFLKHCCCRRCRKRWSSSSRNKFIKGFRSKSNLSFTC